MRTRESVGALVCFACLTIQPSRAVSNAEPVAWPPNISVDPDLHEEVTEMLRGSGTFRSQFRLLGKMPKVRVRIELEEHPGSSPEARAQCELARYEFGAITALVRVWSRPDAIELIAHELEHVLEFAAGTNYRMLAVLEPGSVWQLPGGAFETTRAVEAGLRVKREAGPGTARLRARR